LFTAIAVVRNNFIRTGQAKKVFALLDFSGTLRMVSPREILISESPVCGKKALNLCQCYSESGCLYLYRDAQRPDRSACEPRPGARP